MKKTDTHFLKTVEAENGLGASVDACFSTGEAMRAATECLCAPVLRVRGTPEQLEAEVRHMDRMHQSRDVRLAKREASVTARTASIAKERELLERWAEMTATSPAIP